MITEVNLHERSYNIYIENDLSLFLEVLCEIPSLSSVTVLSDSNVAEIYSDILITSLQESGIPVHLKIFPAGENSKSFEQASIIYDFLIEKKVDRKGAIIALGGGVTGDLAGFIAATYMRGIAFIQVPTSLLAMVDSSVGGKVAVNHPRGKNMVGCFYQPYFVYTGLNTLSTLPDEEFSSGMAEVIKHGIIRDRDYFSFIDSNIDKILALENKALTEVVAGSCRIKAEVVSIDEKESGLRAVLNFGHTAAHAFETLTSYCGYRHGEAVSIGIIAACRLSELKFGFSAKHTDNIEQLLKRAGLPVRFRDLDVHDIYDSMLSDKKTEGGVIRFVLAKDIGEVEIVSISDKNIIIEAIEAVRE
ncbi:MAG: 3-dehydroquinate synthase [Planctomycetota bacterium]|jgi:3-dehydroquinate synthase